MLLGLITVCLRDIDPSLQAVLIVFGVIVVFPSVVLLGIDLGKAINREGPVTARARRLAAILTFPPVIFGAILIGAGLVIPFIGLRIELNIRKAA